jgi:2-C-methyl-D-erythritol 4-phosphate cytidylyltransferase
MNYALIVAGGNGKRMNNALPKQFIELEGKPILLHTIQKFLDFAPDINLVVVLPLDSIDEFKSRYFQQDETNRVSFVVGGDTRFHSVQNGLMSIHDEGVVFIHDGVRPFVSAPVLERCLKIATECGNAVPYIDLKDSIRKRNEQGNIAVSRNEYKAIQTPQTFDISAIKNAFQQTYNEAFTDEASVFEAAGHSIYLVEGNEENIKITTPQDLAIATYLLQHTK